MEFRVTNRITGAKQAVPSAKGERSSQNAGSAAVNQTRADKLALSQQAVKMLEERTKQEAQERAKKQLDRMSGKEGESSSSPLDAAVKALKTMRQCQKIAARIRAGDNVPAEDKKFLQENDPAGYQLAMASRKLKKDPKDYDSVLEEEKEGNSTSGVSGSGGASDSGGDPVSMDTEPPAES